MIRTCLLVATGLAALCVVGYAALAVLLGAIAPLATVDAAELDSVPAGFGGSLVLTTGDDSLWCVTFPSMETVELAAGGRVLRVAGPDANGRVVYAEEAGRTSAEQGPTEVRLMVANVTDWVPAELKTIRGSGQLWEHAAFAQLSMSSDSGKVSFWAYSGHSNESGAVAEFTGTRALEIMSLDGEHLATHQVRGRAFDHQWRPGTNELAFSRPEVSPELAHALDLSRGGDSDVEVICFLDATTGQERAVVAGSRAVFSTCGDALVFTDAAGDVWRMDIASGVRRRVNVPGLLRPIGLVGTDLLIYEGLTTAGHSQDVQWAMGWVERMWTVKVAVLDSTSCFTALPSVGTFHGFSFGP